MLRGSAHNLVAQLEISASSIQFMDSFAAALSTVSLKCKVNPTASASFQRQPHLLTATLFLAAVWRCSPLNSACVLWIVLMHASPQFREVSVRRPCAGSCLREPHRPVKPPRRDRRWSRERPETDLAARATTLWEPSG